MGDHIILVGHCDIFFGRVILLNISNTIWLIYIILKALVQYDTLSEPKVLIGQCDLYFNGK